MNKNFKFRYLLLFFLTFVIVFYFLNQLVKDKQLKDLNANDYTIEKIQKKFAGLFSDSVVILDEWKIYQLEICCDFPKDFKVSKYDEIKLDKFIGRGDGEIRFYDPFVFYKNGIKNILYETCFFDLEIKYDCTINLAKIISDKVVENKILHNPNYKISYPQIVVIEGNIFVTLEEIGSEDGFPGIYEIKDDKLILINKPIKTKLYDTTYFYHEKIYYAFGTDSNGNLRLYYGKDPRKENFIEHKLSPLTKDKKLNRMAGNIIKIKDKIYRFSMNNEKTYGEGINLVEIKILSKNNYEEILINEKIFSQTLIDDITNLRHHIVLDGNDFESGKIKVIIDGSNLWPMTLHGKKMRKIKRD